MKVAHVGFKVGFLGQNRLNYMKLNYCASAYPYFLYYLEDIDYYVQEVSSAEA